MHESEHGDDDAESSIDNQLGGTMPGRQWQETSFESSLATWVSLREGEGEGVGEGEGEGGGEGEEEGEGEGEGDGEGEG